ncbi:hypothetical protein G9A89_010845 [Geosiphon pyriformis]|nr:hypothetical protein G9A89_010845 [Geosiphon pyriformis]
MSFLKKASLFAPRSRYNNVGFTAQICQRLFSVNSPVTLEHNATFNRVLLGGIVTDKPRFFQNPQGYERANYSIATYEVNRHGVNETLHYIQVRSGMQMDNIKELNTGDYVFVEGQLKSFIRQSTGERVITIVQDRCSLLQKTFNKKSHVGSEDDDQAF